MVLLSEKPQLDFFLIKSVLEDFLIKCLKFMWLINSAGKGEPVILNGRGDAIFLSQDRGT